MHRGADTLDLARPRLDPGIHGLGASGHDFEPIVPLLGLDRLGVRFVFPHAPERAVTINYGMMMPAWYDIGDIDLCVMYAEFIDLTGNEVWSEEDDDYVSGMTLYNASMGWVCEEVTA